MKRVGMLAGPLTLALFAIGLPPEGGMWMPQQAPELGARLKALGFTGDAKTFADLTGQPMGAVVHWAAARRRPFLRTA